MIIEKNFIIGGIIIVLNLIALFTKRQELLPVTLAISLLLAIISQFLN